jgi:hypothetical protein
MQDDTPDQKRLRQITHEVEALLKKHDVGGVVLLASAESAAWLHVIPTWAGIIETAQGMVVHLRTKSDHALTRTEHTLHLIGCLRDMAHDCNAIYGRMYRAARGHLSQHNHVDHIAFAGGRRIDPFSDDN